MTTDVYFMDVTSRFYYGKTSRADYLEALDATYMARADSPGSPASWRRCPAVRTRRPRCPASERRVARKRASRLRGAAARSRSCQWPPPSNSSSWVWKPTRLLRWPTLTRIASGSALRNS